MNTTPLSQSTPRQLPGQETQGVSSVGQVDALNPLLLTPQPLETLLDDLLVFKVLAGHFRTINDALYFKVSADPMADNLRASFLELHETMQEVSWKIDTIIFNAELCYVYSTDEEPSAITNDMLEIFRDPKWQQEIVDATRIITNEAKAATHMLRTIVIPRVPLMEQEISIYIDSYRKRYDPEYPQSTLSRLFGSIAPSNSVPAQWNLEGVMSIAFEFKRGVALLNRLPWFLDNVELHFWRLSRLNAKDISAMGYRTSDDFRRLYADQLYCHRITLKMVEIWRSSMQPFISGVAIGELRLKATRTYFPSTV